MHTFGLHIVPILVCCLMVLALVISYALAAKLEHISPLFPYISDTGTHAPESCIFGQLLNMAAALSGFSSYLWYKQAKTRLAHFSPIRFSCLCLATLIFGLLSAFGLSLVANFQETSVWSVHLTGAALLYLCGLIYMVLVTHITAKYGYYNLRLFRINVCVCAAIALVLLPITGTIARFMYDGTTIRKWKPSDRGYPFHAVSSFSEWVVAFCFLMFYCSMILEMRDFSFHAVHIEPNFGLLGEEEEEEDHEEQEIGNSS